MKTLDLKTRIKLIAATAAIALVFISVVYYFAIVWNGQMIAA